MGITALKINCALLGICQETKGFLTSICDLAKMFFLFHTLNLVTFSQHPNYSIWKASLTASLLHINCCCYFAKNVASQKCKYLLNTYYLTATRGHAVRHPSSSSSFKINIKIFKIFLSHFLINPTTFVFYESFHSSPSSQFLVLVKVEIPQRCTTALTQHGKFYFSTHSYIN